MQVLDPEKRIGIPEIKKHPFFKGINWNSLHTQTPPSIKPFPGKLVFEEDILADQEAKKKKMQEEESEKWYFFIVTACHWSHVLCH
jgi:hypothetical protein